MPPHPNEVTPYVGDRNFDHSDPAWTRVREISVRALVRAIYKKEITKSEALEFTEQLIRETREFVGKKIGDRTPYRKADDRSEMLRYLLVLHFEISTGSLLD